MNLAINMPPIAPAVPPIPTTEPTAVRGNRSDGSVSKLAEKAWCPAVASPRSSTASHSELTSWTNTTGSTAKAQASIVSLRARFTDIPAFIILDEAQPPITLPASDIT